MLMYWIWVWISFPTHIYAVSSSTPAGIYGASTPPPGSGSLLKNLMLLKAGSGTRFDYMWGLDSHNDAGNTKPDMGLVDVLSGGEFKAAIDPSWGESEWVSAAFITAHGDIIGEIQFYVPNKNITGQTAWMSSTFDIILPLNIGIDSAYFTVSGGDMELLVRKTASSDTWMAVYHRTSGLDPEFVLATYVSETFVTDTSTAASYMGCKPTTTLAVAYKITDATGMTVENCFTLCELSEYQFVGIKFGYDCFCINITISNLYDDLPAYCGKTCSGDSSQTCGGLSEAYMSVYNITQPLLSLSEVENTTLLTVTHTGYITEKTINLQTEGSWPDDYIYINGLKVMGGNSTGYDVSYYIEYVYNNGDTFVPYRSELNGTVWTGQTGVTYGIEVLLLRQLTVKFSEPTTGVTITLIGPTGNSTNPGYVTADYMLVYGTFTTATSTTRSTSTTTSPNSTTSTTSTTTPSPTTSSTTTATSTPATTTTILTTASSTTLSPSITATSAPLPTTSTLPSPVSSTTVASTTTAVSNYSIVINGQVYCPCTVFANSATNDTVDIAAIIAELTLDKDTLSSNTRKYNSAYDSRPSAKTLGALGVIIISFVIGLIVTMDSANLKAEAVKIKKNYRHLKKQLSNKSLRIDDISTSNNHDANTENLPVVLM